MGWPHTSKWLGTAALFALGCEKEPTQQKAGELGNGVFTYSCSRSSDAQCDDEHKVSASAFDALALGAYFQMGGPSGTASLNPASDLRVVYAGATAEWHTVATGHTAVMAIGYESEVIDMVHLHTVAPTQIVVAKKLISGDFSGEIGNVSFDVDLDDAIQLRAAPADADGNILAGALPCTWTSMDATVVEISGDETDNVVSLITKNTGQGKLLVELGELAAEVTVDVGVTP